MKKKVYRERYYGTEKGETKVKETKKSKKGKK